MSAVARLALHLSAASAALTFRAPPSALARTWPLVPLLPHVARSRNLAVLMGEQSGAEKESQLPMLPSEVEKRASKMKTIEVDGHSLALDELGPIIIKEDGRLGSLANWHEMTEGEQKLTMSFIAKRNAKRRNALLKRQAEEKEAAEALLKRQAEGNQSA
eukprot:scaffold195728_cov24-Tisochrysis_lutea.AAC.2